MGLNNRRGEKQFLEVTKTKYPSFKYFSRLDYEI